MAKTEKKKDLDWLIKNYMSLLEGYGMSEVNIINHYQIWKKDRPENIEDYLWYIFNTLLYENARQSKNLIELFKRNVEIYSNMISFRRKIEGKKANEIQRLYNSNKVNLDLELRVKSKVKIDFIIIGTIDCNESKRVSGKIITSEQAIKNDVIPYNECTRKQGCVCLMNIIPQRGTHGRLIRD